MDNLYFYSVWKHPLLLVTLPLWLLFAIVSLLVKEQAGTHRRR